MIEKQVVFYFVCDNCKDSYISVPADTLVAAVDIVRSMGWAVSSDRKKCYCDKCRNYVNFNRRYKLI